MIRPVFSRGLGVVLIFDGAARPRLAPATPAFHVDEVRLLSETKAPLAIWQEIAFVRQVFPEAYLVEWHDFVKLRQQRERLWKRTRRWAGPGGPRPGHTETPDDD